MQAVAPTDQQDLAKSTLYNEDLAPVPAAQRVWTTYNYAALWIAMAHCIPTYAYAGGLIALGMNAWQAMLTITLGNLIVLVPILLNAHAGTKYGIPFPVFARASFGSVGANVPALLRAFVACGWFGIQTSLGGEAVKVFVQALWPGFEQLGGGGTFLGLSLPSAICFFVFWTLNMVIIFAGMNMVRHFENWAAPLVLVMAGVLLVWVVYKAGGIGGELTKPSQFSSTWAFLVVFVPSVTGMVGFWSTLSLNIPDFSRFGKGQKQQLIGQSLGLPPTMIGFSAMGLVITSAAAAMLNVHDTEGLKELFKPEYLLSVITSAEAPPGLSEPLISSAVVRIVVAVLALFGIAIATISVNIAANVISPANDFANLAPKYIGFRLGALITGVLGVVILPWKLLSSPNVYIFDWLVGYSALLGPIAAILIVDYWILRRCELDVPDLYRWRGRYGLWNWVAMVALFAGILPNVPGFFVAVHGVDLLVWLATSVPALEPVAQAAVAWSGVMAGVFSFAWFSGFFIAGAVYWLGSVLFANDTNRGR